MKIIVIGAGPEGLAAAMMFIYMKSSPLLAGVTLSFNWVISRLIQVLSGEGEGYVRFMNDTKRKMDRFHHYLRPKVMKALP